MMDITQETQKKQVAIPRFTEKDFEVPVFTENDFKPQNLGGVKPYDPGLVDDNDTSRAGFWTNLGKKFSATIYDLGKGITEMPQWQEATQNTYVKGLTNAYLNRQVKKGNIDRAAADEFMGRYEDVVPKMGFMYPVQPGKETLGEKIAESGANKWLGGTAEQLRKEANRYDKGVTDYLKNKEWGKAFGAEVTGVVESMPYTIAAAFGGAIGAAGLGAVVGSQKYDEVKDREDMSDAMKLIDATSTAFWESFFEYIGTKQITDILKRRYATVAKDKVEDGIKRGITGFLEKAYKKFGVWFAPVHEGTSEFATQVAQNLTAKYTGEDPNRNPWDGAMDSFLIGMGMGTMSSAVEQGMEQIPKYYQRKLQGGQQPVVEFDPDQGVKDIINVYGERLKFNSNVPLAEDQNPLMSMVKHKIEDKIYFLTGESGKLGDHVFTGYDYDALKEAGYDFSQVTPKLIKASDIRERMDIPYNDWLQVEVDLYKQTQAQGQQLMTKAQAPVQEGQEITLGDKTFNVTFIDENGITLNEIDKNGNLTEGELIVPPEDYEKVFGVPAVDSGQISPNSGQISPENVTEQGLQPQNNVTEQGQSTSVDNTLIPQLPVNKKGEIEYEKIAKPEDYAYGLTEEFGEEAPAILDELIAEQETALEKAKKGTNAIERARKVKGINAELKKLQGVKEILTPTATATQGNLDAQSASPVVEQPEPIEQATAQDVASPDFEKPQKYTLNLKNNDLPQAPKISVDNVDWIESGLEDGLSEAFGDIKSIKLLEARGRNMNGRLVGTVLVIGTEKAETFEVFFNESNENKSRPEEEEPAGSEIEQTDETEETQPVVKATDETPSTPDETTPVEAGVQEAPEVQKPAKEAEQPGKRQPLSAFKKGDVVRNVAGDVWEVVEVPADKDINAILRDPQDGSTTEWNQKIVSWTLEKKEVSPEAKLIKANTEVDVNPTEAQKEAENYKMGHVRIKGLDITIQNPVGSVRKGTDKKGNEWAIILNNTYGYIRGTVSPEGKGKKKDQVDVFLGDNLDSDSVYVIDQIDPETGKWDEPKIMLGFRSLQDAKDNYLANYEPGWKGLGDISKMSMDAFKEWVFDKEATQKPLAYKEDVEEEQNPSIENFTKADATIISRLENTIPVDFKSHIDDFRNTGKMIRYKEGGVEIVIYDDSISKFPTSYTQRPSVIYINLDHLSDAPTVFLNGKPSEYIDAYYALLHELSHTKDLEDVIMPEQGWNEYINSPQEKRAMDVGDKWLKMGLTEQPGTKGTEGGAGEKTKYQVDETTSEISPKSLKQLESENKSTAPKIPTNKVFLNEVEIPPREESSKVDDFFDTGDTDKLSVMEVNVRDIIPTQKNLTIRNLKETQGQTAGAILLKHNGKYYILDGHHRIANDILEGNETIEAYVYDTAIPVTKTPQPAPDFAGEALDNTPRVRVLTEFKKGDIVKNVQTKKEYEVVSITKVGKSFNVSLKEKGSNKISNFNGKRAQWVPVQKEVTIKVRKKPSKANPNSKTAKALSYGPNNFEEAVMHFFIGGGKIWIEDVKSHVVGAKNPQELRKFFGLYANDGIHMDVLHDYLPNSFGIEDNADAMAEIDSIVEVMNNYRPRGAMMDELIRRQEEPVDMSYSEEDYSDEADTLEPEVKEVSNDILDDPQIKEITEEFMNDDGSLAVDKLLAKIEEDEGYFTIFPFAIKQGKLQSLKERLQDEQRRRSQQDSQVRPGVGDTEGEGRGTDSDRSGERDEGRNGAEEGREGKRPIEPREQVISSLKGKLTNKYQEWLSDENEDDFEYYLDSEIGLTIDDDGIIDVNVAIDDEIDDLLKGQKIYVYHATSDALIESISKDGLKLRKDVDVNRQGKPTQGVYVSTTPSGPAMEGYKYNAVQQFGGDPIVLKAKLKYDDLRSDPDDEDIRSGAYQFVVSKIKPEDIELPERNEVAPPKDDIDKLNDLFAERPEKPPVEQPQGGQYKYKMSARPFDIGTYPKEGFVKAEDDPKGGFQILTYDRKLSEKERSHWSFLPLTEIDELKDKQFEDPDGEYFVDLEWMPNYSGADVSMFDSKNQLVEKPYFMSTNEILKNIEGGYWKEKKEVEKPKEEKKGPQNIIIQSPEERHTDTEDNKTAQEQLDRGFKVWKTFFREKGAENWRKAYILSAPFLTKANALQSAKFQLIADSKNIPIGRENEVMANFEFKAEEVTKQEEQSSLSPIQQSQIAKINKEYTESIGKKQSLIDQAEKDMREALLKADERNGLFGDTNPVEKDEIIKREEQGFTYTESTRAAVRKPFEERIAELRKQIEELRLEQKGKIESIIRQQDLFAEPPAEAAESKPVDKESLPKLEDFGEKIGGARKDMNITRTARDTDSMPAWRRKYHYANADGTINLGAPIDTSKPFIVQWSKEIATWNGRRAVYRDVTTIDTREIKVFNSEEEAEAYIPIYEVWKQNFRIRKSGENYVITKTSSTGKAVEYGTFPTEEDATTYMYSTEGATSLLNHKREDFSIPALDKVERTGTDWRKGKDVSTEEFMSTFGFRGGEFGNWVKPEERRVMLNAAYDSFMDLAEILNVPPTALSFGGELSIAFGARGTKGAAAHFEPGRAVINLTRMNGAGSLAHEWAHAMDNYFGIQGAKKDYTRDEKGEVKSGNVMRTTSDLLSIQGMRKELSEKFDKIVEATQSKSVTRVMGIEEKQKAYDKQRAAAQREADALIKKFENGVRRYKYNRQTKRQEDTIIKATPDQVKKAKAIVDKILEGKGTRPKWDRIPGSKSQFGDYSYISPETLALNELYKEVFGHNGLKRDGNGFYNLGYFADKMYHAKGILDKALAGESETLNVATDFLKASKEFDKTRANPYWATKVEMFARAFEYFVQTKLEEKNVRADYLMYDKAPVYDAVYGKNPYPSAEERAELNRLFQEFFDEVKVRTDENNVSLLYENEADYVKDQLDGYDSEDQRQTAVEEAISQTEGRVLDSGLRSAGSILQKILPRTVLKGFKESGYVDFIGQKIESPQDIADLWSIHRSPNIEKSHVIFLKDGRVVGSAATTLNRIGSTMFLKPEDVLRLCKKYGADSVYYLHNHPSGSIVPSRVDVITTNVHNRYLNHHGISVLGGIILDHNKFSLIDTKTHPVEDGDFYSFEEVDDYIKSSVKQFEYKNPQPKLFSERESIVGVGQERMLEISKALLTENKYKGAVVYLSSNLEISAYDVFPEGASVKDVIRLAKQGLENNLGRSVVIIHDGSYGNELSTNGQLPYDTLDVINTAKNESQWFSKEPRKGYANVVADKLWDEESEYKKSEFAGEYLEGKQDMTQTPESFVGKKIVGYRYGKAPESGYSYNYQTNKSENGVSMAKTGYLPEINSFAVLNLKEKGVKKHFYLGTISDEGGDGEILLSNVKEISEKQYKQFLDDPEIIEVSNNIVNFIADRRIDLLNRGYYIGKTVDQIQEWRKSNIRNITNKLKKSATGNRGTFNPESANILEEPQQQYQFAGDWLAKKPAKPPIPPKALNKPQFAGEYLEQLKTGAPINILQKKGEKRKELWQDRMLSVKKWQEQILSRGGVINDISDPYRQENLSHSVVKNAIDNYNDKILTPFEEVAAKVMKEGKMNYTDLNKYMKVKHAPEYNTAMWRKKEIAKIKADEKIMPEDEIFRIDNINSLTAPDDVNLSGFTTTEANALIEKFEDRLTPDLIDEFWQAKDRATQFTLDRWLADGIINQERYDQIKGMFRYYVPMRGFMPTEIDDLYEYQKRDVGEVVNPLRKAKGRKSESDDPIQYIVNMAHTAVVIGEKNRIKQHAARLSRFNKDMSDLHRFKKIYRIYDGTTNPDTNLKNYIEVTEKPTQAMYDAGMVMERNDMGHFKGRPQSLATQHEVDVYISGEKYTMILPADVAEALNKNPSKWDNVAYLMREAKIGQFTRWLSSNFTSKNPAFIILNQMRDVQYATIAHFVKGDTKEAMRFLNNLPKARRAIIQHLKGKGDIKDKYYSMYLDFLRNGGETGYVHLKDVDQLMADIKVDLARLTGTNSTYDKVIHARILRNAGQWLEHMAIRSENMSRFATFIEAKERGLSDKEAAFLAKEITVNFNRKGRISSFMGSLFAFFNASVQGGENVIRMSKQHTGKFLAIGATGMALGFLTALFNNLWGGDDDEGNSEYDQISDFLKYNNLIIMIPGPKKYITIPLPHGFRWFNSLGVLAYQNVFTDDRTLGNTVKDGLSNLFSAISPVNPVEFLSEEGGLTKRPIVPTFLVPFYDISENQTFSGARVHKEPFTLAEKEGTAHSALGMDHVNPAIKKLTDWWFRVGSGNPETGSKFYENNRGEWVPVKDAFDVNPSDVEHILEYFLGGRGVFWNDLVKTGGNIIEAGSALATEDKSFGEALEGINSNEFPVLKSLLRQPWRSSIYSRYYDVVDQIERYKYDVNKTNKSLDITEEPVQMRPDMQYKYDLLKALKRDTKNINDELKYVTDPAMIKEMKDTQEMLIRNFLDEVQKLDQK